MDRQQMNLRSGLKTLGKNQKNTVMNLSIIIEKSQPMIRQKENDNLYISPRELFKTIVCEHDNSHKLKDEILSEHQQVGGGYR